ncbi:CinA family protein [Desulfovibrio sp. OttesenSCG-928-F07]|nr:CinA family protein [Desulfovibrio sp. OttesenSCG-928-F07]
MFFNQTAPLIKKLALALKRHNLTMCTAESCTGGLIAAACTAEAGSSAWFCGGIVSYTNNMKMRVLKVNEDILQELGAVSLPVVKQMTIGACKACNADCAVAVSGIAGPDGGSAQKPVGTVCIAVAVPQGIAAKQPLHTEAAKLGKKQVFSATFNFNGDRNAVREQTVLQGLELLLKALS